MEPLSKQVKRTLLKDTLLFRKLEEVYFSYEEHLTNQDIHFGPKGVSIREVPPECQRDMQLLLPVNIWGSPRVNITATAGLGR